MDLKPFGWLFDAPKKMVALVPLVVNS